jgi:hypothetical protein
MNAWRKMGASVSKWTSDEIKPWRNSDRDKMVGHWTGEKGKEGIAN